MVIEGHKMKLALKERVNKNRSEKETSLKGAIEMEHLVKMGSRLLISHGIFTGMKGHK